jgi:hypothetical protein
MFYNPAGLARLQYWRFTLPYFMLGTDTHSFDQMQFWAGHANEFTKFPDVSSETGSALANTRIHAVTEGSWKYVGPHFGCGMWLTTDDLMTTSAVLVPQVHWDVRAALKPCRLVGVGRFRILVIWRQGRRLKPRNGVALSRLKMP